MAQIVFRGYWSEDWQKEIPKGIFGTKPDEVFKKPLGKFLNKLTEWQKKKGELIELKFTVDVHYKKRTIEQNNLLFALYTVEANELNAGMKGNRKQMVSVYELYEEDLKKHARIIPVILDPLQAMYIRREYKIVKEEQSADGKIILYLMVSTSKMTTVEMAEWIDMVFNRIASMGCTVTNPAQIQDYWVQWRRFLNDSQVVLHEQPMTEAEYKALNPICEAHGSDCYLANGGGSLFHINAVGMGGNAEASKGFPSNWLHTCDTAHMLWHNNGIENFLKLFPHLAYKINTAMKRDYEPEEKTEEEKTTEQGLLLFQDQVSTEIEETEPVKEEQGSKCIACGTIVIGDNSCPCGGLGFF